MPRLISGELQAFSRFDTLTGNTSRELDFGLGVGRVSRIGVVINAVEGMIMPVEVPTTTQASAHVLQHLDLDPDNTQVVTDLQDGGSGTAIATSVLFFQEAAFHTQIMATSGGWAYAVGGQKEVDFRRLAFEDRPIAVRNMRHHLEYLGFNGNVDIDALLVVRYQLVELTDLEISRLALTRF